MKDAHAAIGLALSFFKRPDMPFKERMSKLDRLIVVAEIAVDRLRASASTRQLPQVSFQKAGSAVLIQRPARADGRVVALGPLADRP